MRRTFGFKPDSMLKIWENQICSDAYKNQNLTENTMFYGSCNSLVNINTKDLIKILKCTTNKNDRINTCNIIKTAF